MWFFVVRVSLKCDCSLQKLFSVLNEKYSITYNWPHFRNFEDNDVKMDGNKRWESNAQHKPSRPFFLMCDCSSKSTIFICYILKEKLFKCWSRKKLFGYISQLFYESNRVVLVVLYFCCFLTTGHDFDLFG